MTESIGTARLDIVVDTAGMEAGIDRAKRSVSGMSAAAQAEYNKLSAAEKRRVDSLIRQADVMGLTRQGQLAYNAAMKTSGAIQQELLTRIRATEQAQQAATQATKAGTTALNQYRISATQTAAAMRGVPAQLTDIFTSLQGGQNPLTVLLQQGGQLKDMFGGIVPAARALGSSLVGLVNPYTVTAAAAGALAFAWVKGQKESERFNEALILTGNFAGTTADELAALATQMDGLAGVTTSSAANALATVATTGKFTGEQIALVATAAEQMRVATGRAIEETVAEFEELRKDPVKAILELNDKYHFLTQAQLDRIQALKDEGREQDAATEAFRSYADAIESRTAALEGNVNALGSAWRDVKRAISEAADAWLNIGRNPLPAPATNAVSTLGGALPFSSLIGGQAGVRALVTGVTTPSRKADFSNVQGSATETIVDSSKIRAQQKAQEEFDRIAATNLDRRAKLEREIVEIRELGVKAGKSEAEIEVQIGAARKRYQESLPKGRTRKTALTEEQREAKQLQRAYESLEEQMDRQVALFGDTTRAAAVRYDVEKGALAGLSKAQKDGLVAQAEKLDQLREEKDLVEDLKRLREDLAATEVGRSRANAADLLGMSGIGREEFDRVQRRLEIEEEYQDRVAELLASGVKRESEAFRVQEVELRAHRDRSLQVEADYQQQRAALMGDWSVGASQALNDFAEENANVAAQVYGIWREGFQTIEDILVDGLSGNLKSWEDYFENIHQMILRFIVKQQLTKWMESLGSVDASNSGGFMQFLGGLFQSGNGGGWGGIAMGGAFGGGQRIDKYALGGVFDQATMFSHGGRLGVLGEAGPEAIMPLHRGPDGKLGVRVDQRDAPRGPTVVSQSFTQIVQGRMDRSTSEQAARANGREAARGMSRTGR